MSLAELTHTSSVVGHARLLVVHSQQDVAIDMVRALMQATDRVDVRIATSLESANRVASSFDPAVVLLDAHLLRHDTSELARAIGGAGARVVVLAESLTGELVLAALSAGCEGVVFSRESADRFLRACDGDRRVVAEVDNPLTRRQREVLQLIAEGLSTPEIATRLYISRNTARNHVRQVLERLGARSKLQAMTIALRDGLVDLPS